MATKVARALGRSFRFEQGFFADEKADPKDQVLQVKTYTEAYFRALARRPDLKEALSLAERVRVQVAPGRTLVVSPEGPEEVEEAALERFLSR